MNAKTVRRYALTVFAFVFVTCLIGGLFQANVQEWAKATGNDQWMVQYAGVAIASLAATARTSWFIALTAFLVGGSLFLWTGYFLQSTSEAPPLKRNMNSEKSVPAAYVVDVQMGQSGGANPNLITVNFESAISGRIRIYIEHSLLSNEWSKPVKIRIADFADAFRGQRLNVTVLRRNHYLNSTGEKQWDFRFGPEGSEQNNSSFMADFKYKTRLIFEGPDGGDQFYNFQIVQPDKIAEDWVPKIATQDDTKPW